MHHVVYWRPWSWEKAWCRLENTVDDVLLATQFKLSFAKKLSREAYTVTVSDSVKNYAGLNLESAYSQEKTAESTIEGLKAELPEQVIMNDKIDIPVTVLSDGDVSDYTISCESSMEEIVAITDISKVDENGVSHITADAKLPGTVQLTISLEGSMIQTQLELSVLAEKKPEEPQKISLENLTIPDIPDQKYTGSEVRPEISIEGLVQGTDYTLKYENNVEPGTATVIVEGIGNYTGEVRKSFQIVKEKQEEEGGETPGGNKPGGGTSSGGTSGGNTSGGNTSGSIAKKAQTIKVAKASYSLTYKKTSFSLKASAKTKLTYKSSNKKAAVVSRSGKVTVKGYGTIVITITAAENQVYKGVSKKVIVSVKPVKETITGVKGDKKKITVKFKKDALASGYQIQYSTSKKFAKSSTKIVKVSKSAKSKTLVKLKSRKKYYIRMRAYTTSGGKTLYGSWSKVKTCTAK